MWDTWYSRPVVHILLVNNVIQLVQYTSNTHSISSQRGTSGTVDQWYTYYWVMFIGVFDTTQHGEEVLLVDIAAPSSTWLVLGYIGSGLVWAPSEQRGSTCNKDTQV